MSKRSIVRLLSLAILSLSLSQAKAVDLVLNGSFELNGGVGQLENSISYATGWTRTIITDPIGGGFAFIVDSQSDSNTFPSILSPQQIWGPGSGVNNGFTGSSDGGYFMGINGGFSISSISQVINGLTPGMQYKLEYQWAASQIVGFNGATQQYWSASLDSESHDSPATNIPNQGFSGWMNQQDIFTATSSSATLTFTPNGSPVGSDPFLLLDGVRLTAVSVPEPSTYAFSAVAIFALGLAKRRKLRAKS